MGRGRRAAAALCRTAPRRAGRRAAAGAAAPGRPHHRRRDVVGAAGKARPLRRRKPIRRIADPGRCHGVAAGAGGARYRAGQPDLGAAGRRHPAGDRRKAGPRLDRAGAHDGKRRVVQSGALRPVRRDAAADRGDEPWGGRGERGDAAAAADARRVRPAATRPADGAADRRQGNRDRDRLAAASARVLRHSGFASRAQSVGRDRRAGADRAICLPECGARPLPAVAKPICARRC